MKHAIKHELQHALRPQAGFTLIELIVVVVIIAILSAIAYPSYVESVRKGHRASAKARMFDVQSRLQRYYSDKGRYTVTLADLDLAAPLTSESKGHTIALAAGAAGIASTYTITATPVKADPSCPSITLDHLGVYSPLKC